MNNIIIPNPEQFILKKKNLVDGGADNLHIVADYDRTLTQCFVNGQKAHTGIAQIREGGYLSEDYVQEAFALYDHYRPIEVDPTISSQERSKKMIEWWEKHLALKVKCGMNKGVLDDIIKKKKLVYRDGTLDFLETLHNHHIPILIFSAGLGDLICRSLDSHQRYFCDTHVISNFYQYDNQGNILGYKGAIVHSFNKNETHVKDHKYQDQIKQRKNTLLLGDSLQDPDMALGIDHATILKIGFCNDPNQKNLDSYQEAYDVVIVNDGPMDFVNELVKEIIQ